MTELVPHHFRSGRCGEEVELFLFQMKNESDGALPVLLLHGASAQHGSFLIPGPDLDGSERALAYWLHAKGFEPWLLDWRGSHAVVDHARETEMLQQHPQVFDFDHAAAFDVPGALRQIREVRRDAAGIAAVGHCMGAGVLAQAIASGAVTEEHRLKRVVLLTLGLFYEPTLESQLKAQGHALELLQLHSQPPVLVVDPRVPIEDWPPSLKVLYGDLAHEPHPNGSSPADGICNRLCFMYGAPYQEAKLVPEIHRDTWTLRFAAGRFRPEPDDLLRGATTGAEATLLELRHDTGQWRCGNAAGEMRLEARNEKEFARGEALVLGTEACADIGEPRFARALLPMQFGAIPLAMFTQGARNVRRGWPEPEPGRVDLVSRQRAAHFVNSLDAITLITGRDNRLWQARGIHRMHEWLLNSGTAAAGRKCRRYVEDGFGHQDLLWGRDSYKRVFPKIRDGLLRDEPRGG